MGLRCLLGHDFGPPEIEREREETGDEMIVTVRDVETCRRCGEERVVSENKEVTAIRSPSEVDLDDGEDDAADRDATATGTEPSDSDTPTASADASPSPPETGGSDVVAEGSDDGVIIDDDGERAPGGWPDSDGLSTESTATESSDRVDAAADAIADAADDGAQGQDVADVAAEEDAELLDAGGDASGTADDVATERPDAAGAPAAEADAWPDHGGADEGFDADQATTGGPTDVSFGGGLTPDAATATDRERGEYVGTDGASDEEGFEDMVRVDSDADEDADETEFFCPNCGLSERAGETSMRVGDICPSCHKGYVAERNA
jgi:hypothetical protein